MDVTTGLLDAASGQPMNPAAREALMAALDAGWADPRRLYRAGRQAALLRDAARESLATALGVRPEGLHVCCSWAEALDAALRGLPAGAVAATAVEHSALLSGGDAREAAGRGELRLAAVDRRGRVDLDSWAQVLPGAVLACCQQANHEVGTCQPLGEAAERCERDGVPLLVDAGATLGHLPVAPEGHVVVAQALSWGGPAGVGLIASRQRVRGIPRGQDSDTLQSLPLLLAAARGWEWATAQRARTAARDRALTELLARRIASEVEDVVMLGDLDDRLPHLVAFSCLYIDGESIVRSLDAAGFAVSSGSSCVADTRRPSHILVAMGAVSHGNVRITLPYDVDEGDVQRFADALPGIVRSLRKEMP